jgi:hypothetical protein
MVGPTYHRPNQGIECQGADVETLMSNVKVQISNEVQISNFKYFDI